MPTTPNIIPPGATILYDIFGNEYYSLPSGQTVFLRSGIPPIQIPITAIIGTTNKIIVTQPISGTYQVDISPYFIANPILGATSISGILNYTGSTPINGYHLTTDGSGNASWTQETILTTKVTLTTAQILQLFTTPITLVANPGVGYAVSVIDCQIKSTYAGVAYATNTNLDIMASGASTFQKNFSINYTTNYFGNQNNNGIGSGTHVENVALIAKARTGNPTAGTSDITIYLAYRIITL